MFRFTQWVAEGKQVKVTGDAIRCVGSLMWMTFPAE